MTRLTSDSELKRQHQSCALATSTIFRPAHRGIEVYEDGAFSQSYTYDDNGDRLSLDTPTGSTTATHDDQDRLLTYGDFAYTYTENGELLSKTDTATSHVTLYEFDVFGNLVRVDLPDGTVIECLVDGQNRRVGKAVDGVLVKQWLCEPRAWHRRTSWRAFSGFGTSKRQTQHATGRQSSGCAMRVPEVNQHRCGERGRGNCSAQLLRK